MFYINTVTSDSGGGGMFYINTVDSGGAGDVLH